MFRGWAVRVSRPGRPSSATELSEFRERAVRVSRPGCLRFAGRCVSVFGLEKKGVDDHEVQGLYDADQQLALADLNPQYICLLGQSLSPVPRQYPLLLLAPGEDRPVQDFLDVLDERSEYQVPRPAEQCLVLEPEEPVPRPLPLSNNERGTIDPAF